MITVLVIDDHLMIRKGLMRMLEELDTPYAVDQAEDAPRAFQKLRAAPFDAVLLDVALGERDGFDVLKTIRSEFPTLGVVMLSVYPESQFAVRAIRSGAHAYLNKGCSPEELDKALQSAKSGQVFLTPTTANLLAHDIRSPSDRPPHERLSNRELQVLRLLASGVTVQDIASQLCLSGNTVSTYRARIFEKLEFKNLVDLVDYARAQQWK
jgi:two-component system, NarL family, invasion response regulator UvrY